MAPGSLIAVRTEITELLVTQASRWTRGASQRVPDDLELRPSGLRLWAIATGRADESGYLLAMADPDGPVHRAGGGQLAKLNVAAVDVGVRGGPGWRITSAKRLRRLAELIGEPPAGAQSKPAHQAARHHRSRNRGQTASLVADGRRYSPDNRGHGCVR
jgi:hypothetical protein